MTSEGCRDKDRVIISQMGIIFPKREDELYNVWLLSPLVKPWLENVRKEISTPVPKWCPQLFLKTKDHPVLWPSLSPQMNCFIEIVKDRCVAKVFVPIMPKPFFLFRRGGGLNFVLTGWISINLVSCPAICVRLQAIQCTVLMMYYLLLQRSIYMVDRVCYISFEWW